MKKLYSHLFLSIIFIASLSACKKSIVNPNELENETDPQTVLTNTSNNHFFQLTSDSLSKALFFYNSPAKYALSTRGFQGCPSVGSENGHLYAAWFNNVIGKGEDPGNYISVAVSEDMGRTWKQDALIIAPDKDGNRITEPMFWNDRYGNLHLSYMMTVGMWDGATGGDWTVGIKEVNGQISITKPTKLFPGDMNVKPTITNDSTKILFPTSGWGLTSTSLKGYTIAPTSPYLNGLFIYKADYTNKQEAFNIVKVAKVPTTYARVFDEAMIVDMGNNNLTLMKRTNSNGITTMKSADNGLSWNTESMFKDLGPTTSSRFYFGKLKSGNLLFVLNNSTTRESMTAYLSKDNGKTWPYKLLIDARSGVSYPDVTQNNNNGDIFITYDYNRTTNGQIVIVKLREQDIMYGSTGNVQLTTISNLN